MTSIIAQVKGLLEQVGREFGIEGVILLDFPADLSFGDLTTNVAMMYAKGLGRNPKELASEIVEKVASLKSELVSDISVAGPGFINLKLSEKALLDAREWVVSTSSTTGYNSNIHADKKILVEHSSPNLFKPFHIGHLMNNTIGESVTRLMKASGANVTAISYPSDISLGIAKAVCAILHDESFKDCTQDVQTAGKAYVAGTRLYEESDEIKNEVKKIVNILYAKQVDTPEYQTYKTYSDISREYLFKSLEKTVGSHFDGFIFESEAGEVGKKLIQENLGNVFTESDGAVIYEGEKDGLHTRVFINSEGNPTYEAKDVGLMALKFERYSPDLSLFVTDHEQGPYFSVVKKAAGKINKNWEEKTVHLIHGRMSFKGAKMSSRLGNTPTAEEILGAVYEEVALRIKKNEDGTFDEQIAHDIALGAIKFAILRSKPGSNINFDPETSLSFEGDSGPYLMYTHARICSLLEKAANLEVPILPNTAFPLDWKSLPIESLLMQFPIVVEKAQLDYAPHYMVTYLLALAQEFNSWYGNTKMIDTDQQAAFRLSICDDVKSTLKEGLWMLGMNAPEKM